MCLHHHLLRAQRSCSHSILTRTLLPPLSAPHAGSNIVVAVNGQNCVGSAAYVPGHATQIYDNDCIVYKTERVDDLFENCNTPIAPLAAIRGYNNRFYTEKGNASATCDCCGLRPLKDLPKGLEDNFTASLLPTGDAIIAMGRSKLFVGGL